MRRQSINIALSRFSFFNTEEEARSFIKRNGWRKYNLSSNQDGTCWTLYHSARRV